MNPGALSPRRAHPATASRDTISTAISVASNAAHQRDPIHKTDHACQNRATPMNTSGYLSISFLLLFLTRRLEARARIPGWIARGNG